MVKFISIIIMLVIISLIAILSIFIIPSSGSETIKHDYKHDADTPFYMYKDLHVKTEALHQIYPQLKVMPDIKLSSEIIPVLKDAGKCSNQLCDILMSEYNKPKPRK